MSDLLIIEKNLKSNPIYALSLSSRELFHSNFIRWMVENYPMMLEAIIPNSISGKVEVKREYKNLDLVIEFGEPNGREVVVIEVKVKDTPSLDQLEKYDGKIKDSKYFNQFCVVHKILLSLVEAPKAVEKNSNWRCLHFRELGAKILKLSQKIDDGDDRSVVIRDYADLCSNLGSLVAMVTKEDASKRKYAYFKKNPDIIDETDKLLKRINFLDTIEKQRASVLCREIEKRFEGVNFNSLKPRARPGFDRKMAHVGAAVILEKDASRNFNLDLGVHIQGLQYRRVLSFSGYPVQSRKQGKDAEGIRSFIDETDGWQWMFSSNHSNGFFHKPEGLGGFFIGKTKIPSRQQRNKLLCSYAPIHIYQYTDIGVASGVPVGKVVDAVIEDLQYASELLANPDYVVRFEDWLKKS